MTHEELELELKEHIVKTASRMLILLQHIERLEDRLGINLNKENQNDDELQILPRTTL